jgi:trimeric autotransporter adhesin
VEYRRGDLTEWYVNGPSGLEQGFTVALPPARASRRPLTIAMKLSGIVKTTMDASGSAMSLTTPGNRSPLRYEGLSAYDADGRTLRSWLELRGQQLLIHVDVAEARYPVVVDPYIEVAKLTASDGIDNDLLGFSVAFNDALQMAVVGAPYKNIGTHVDIGAVYVFRKGSAGWTSGTQTARLVGFPSANFDR